MSFLLKVWLAILVGPILLWLGALALTVILANGGGTDLLATIGLVLALALWPKGRKPKS